MTQLFRQKPQRNKSQRLTQCISVKWGFPRLFPLRHNDKLNIEFNSVGVDLIKIKIYNYLGKMINQKEIATNDKRIILDIKEMPQGNYDATFTIGTSTLTNAGSTDIFVAQFDINGVFDSAKGFGSTDSDIVNDVARGGPGNIPYVCGAFKSPTLSFGTTTITNINPGTYDAFIFSIDTNLNNVWANRYGGNNDDQLVNLNIACTGLFMSGSFTSVLIC